MLPGNWGSRWLRRRCSAAPAGNRCSSEAQFHLLTGSWLERPHHRYATAYFHGLPGRGVATFDAAHRRLRALHPRIERIQVSHVAMRDAVLDARVPTDKVFLIPIGVNPGIFRLRTRESYRQAREALGIPTSAVVVGSFQKDGVGWGRARAERRGRTSCSRRSSACVPASPSSSAADGPRAAM